MLIYTHDQKKKYLSKYINKIFELIWVKIQKYTQLILTLLIFK